MVQKDLFIAKKKHFLSKHSKYNVGAIFSKKKFSIEGGAFDAIELTVDDVVKDLKRENAILQAKCQMIEQRNKDIIEEFRKQQNLQSELQSLLKLHM